MIDNVQNRRTSPAEHWRVTQCLERRSWMFGFCRNLFKTERCLSVHLSVCVSICVSVCVSACLSVCAPSHSRQTTTTCILEYMKRCEESKQGERTEDRGNKDRWFLMYSDQLIKLSVKRLNVWFLFIRCEEATRHLNLLNVNVFHNPDYYYDVIWILAK